MQSHTLLFAKTAAPVQIITRHPSYYWERKR